MRSSASPRAVRISIGVRPVSPGRPRSHRAKAKPSSPGIITSSTSRSNASWPTSLRAAAASAAAETRKPARARYSRIRLRMRSSSSITSRWRTVAGDRVHGERPMLTARPVDCVSFGAVYGPPRSKGGGYTDVTRAHGRPRRMDLAGRPVHALARGQGARTDARAALRLGRVRGRADVWRRDLQADRAYRAALQVCGNPRLFNPLHGGADRRGVQGDLREEQPRRLLRPPDRLARLRADGRLGPADQDPRRRSPPGSGRATSSPRRRPRASA